MDGEAGVLVSLWKEMKGKSKESEKGKWKWRETKGKWKEMKGKWKESEREMKEKLSDPSPFNNILNNIQFLLAVVSIKHSYL